MDDNYTFKQILFGLKEEYLLCQERLNLLKSYINLEERKLRDVKFHLSYEYNNDDDVKILCTLYEDKGKIKNKIEELKLRLGIIPNNKVSYVDKVDGIYTIKEYPEIIDKDRIQDFDERVFWILNTNFAKNASFIHIGNGYPGIPFLSVHPSNIDISESGFASAFFSPSKGNYINIYSYNGLLTEEKIKDVFNIEFSRGRFPEYYQDLIENSNCFDKPLEIIGNLGYSKKGNFELIEDSKKLVLRKN